LNVSAGNSAAEDCVDVCGFIAIGIIDDQIVPAINAQDRRQFDKQPRLLPGFANRCIGRLLAGFNQSSLELPRGSCRDADRAAAASTRRE
jgi:hypothetical protein